MRILLFFGHRTRQIQSVLPRVVVVVVVVVVAVVVVVVVVVGCEILSKKKFSFR